MAVMAKQIPKPKGPNAKWEVKEAIGIKELVEYLDDGYEPFAVYKGTFYLKKEIKP